MTVVTTSESLQGTDSTLISRTHAASPNAGDAVSIRDPRRNDDTRLEARYKGYLPTHIGDTLGQYQILHKLGSGIHSVVWLAKRLYSGTTPKFVAIKVFSMRCTDVDTNNGILNIIDNARKERLSLQVAQGLHHLNKMLDQFCIEGPVKRHVCIVIELVGPSLRMVTAYGRSLPRGHLLRFAVQIANALLALHHLRIIHGDLQINNIAYSLPLDLDTLDVEKTYGKPEAILPDEYTDLVAIGADNNCGGECNMEDEPYFSDTYSDGSSITDVSVLEEDQKHIPRYYVLSPDISAMRSEILQSAPQGFQIIDFTCSSLFLPDQTGHNTNPVARFGAPLGVAPPEAHLPDQLQHLLSPTSDMWSFGCLLFLLLSDRHLFDCSSISNERFPVEFYMDVIRSLGKDDPIPDEFFQAMMSLPPYMMRSATAQGSREAVERIPEEFYRTGVWRKEWETGSFRGVMREWVDEVRLKKLQEGLGWTERELDVICAVIKGCVRWDPKSRLTAVEAVEMLKGLGDL